MKVAWLFKWWIAFSQQETNCRLAICTLSLINVFAGVKFFSKSFQWWGGFSTDTHAQFYVCSKSLIIYIALCSQYFTKH